MSYMLHVHRPRFHTLINISYLILREFYKHHKVSVCCLLFQTTVYVLCLLVNYFHVRSGKGAYHCSSPLCSQKKMSK